ncbi:MAG: GTP-binding protein, partial [Mycobacteriales bacterium]
IAEVERALDVLDGVVLVVSAVEGVQPQTRVLMHALRRMQLPTLIFVNKIDRAGARYAGLLADIDRRLTARGMPMQSIAAVGGPEARVANHRFQDEAFSSALAELLADGSDAFLAAYLAEPAVVDAQRLRDEFSTQVAAASIYPIFFGSAITGEGIGELVEGIVTLLPSPPSSGDRTSGTVFKIERDAAGNKVAYLRLHGGTLSARQRVPIYRVGAREVKTFPGKVTRLRVFAGGKAVDASTASGGDIVEVVGLRDVQIGDQLGEIRRIRPTTRFAAPILRTVVQPRRDTDRAGLAVALRLLAEQDPLIDVRKGDDGREISVRLYGEVQKQVIGETLAAKFGIDARFSESEIIYRERPLGVG